VLCLNDITLKKLLSPYFHLVRKDFIKNVEPTLDSKRSAAYEWDFPKFIAQPLEGQSTCTLYKVQVRQVT
jgi:hypothetical protein